MWSATASAPTASSVSFHCMPPIPAISRIPSPPITRRAGSRVSCRATEKRRGSRSSYIGSEVFLSLVDPVNAPFAGDLRQLSVQTLCTNRDLVLQMPVGGGRTDLTLEVAAPVASIRVVSGPSRPYAPLADGAVAWRAISHLSLNYLSLVQSTTDRRGFRAARFASVVRAGGRCQRAASDRGHPVRRRAPCRQTPARARTAGVRPRTGNHGAGGRPGVRRRQRVSAGRGAQSLLRPSRLDQLVHRNRAAFREPRGDQSMEATMGRETDALEFFAQPGRRAVPVRFLPDAAAAGVPVRWKATMGTCLAACRRARAARPGPRSLVRAFAAGVVRRPPGEDRPDCRCVCSGCSGPTGRCRCTSPSTCASGFGMHGDPTLSRFLDIFHHRFIALFYRAWAQAQPHVNHDRPKDDRFTGYVGAFIGLAPATVRDRDACPISRSSSTSAR